MSLAVSSVGDGQYRLSIVLAGFNVPSTIVIILRLAMQRTRWLAKTTTILLGDIYTHVHTHTTPKEAPIGSLGDESAYLFFDSRT